MASAWGTSWGTSWGSAWGAIEGSDAPRKPGFNDDAGQKNRRVPRYTTGNNVLYRLGDDDTPKVDTADNKNRNRFE